MPKIIDHEKRKEEILECAFSLFSDQGYEKTSLSVIADSYGISRPTLYQYFKDKDEIFCYAIKQITDGMLDKYRHLATEDMKNPLETLIQICREIIMTCHSHKTFFSCLSDYLFTLKRDGVDYSKALRRRTIGLTYLFKRLLIDARKKEIIRDIDLDATATQILSLISSAAFQTTLLEGSILTSSIEAIAGYINSLRLKPCD